jgi:hypothetical protein
MRKKAIELTSRKALAEMPVVMLGRGRWEDSVPPEVRADLDDVRAGIKAGEIKQSIDAVFKFLKQKHNLPIASVGSFKSYLERST